MARIPLRFVALLAMAAVLVAACAPAAPQPAAPPPEAPAAAPAAQPAPKEPAAPKVAQPAPKQPIAPAEKTHAVWEVEWERVVAEARREGTVAVTGPHGVEARDALTDPFIQQYGIAVEFFGSPAAATVTRVMTERGAGQYLWDVYVGGTASALATYLPGNVLDPIEQALILPEVTDQSKWREGELEFVDEGRQVLVHGLYHAGRIAINTELVDPSVFSSFRDLLDPEWHGKIVVHDPTSAGPGEATFLFFYMHSELGPDFIRELLRQEPVVVRDIGQSLDLITRGTYPLILGPSDSRAEALTNEGLPIEMLDPRQFRELSDVTPANGAVALYNQAPNPNAAKVYINWVLSQEGQTIFHHAQGSISSRLDVSTDHTLQWKVPAPGAMKTYTKEALEIRENGLRPLLRELLGTQ